MIRKNKKEVIQESKNKDENKIKNRYIKVTKEKTLAKIANKIMEAKKRKLKIDEKFHERKIVKKLLPCRLFTEEPCSENVLQSYVRQRLCRLASSSDKLDFEISAVRLKISYVIHE